MAKLDLSIAIGGAAGQGIATPGDILARIFVRRGLHLNAYNAYQSIVRGGHIFLTLRTSDEPVLSFGDKLDVMIPLNQDTMNRHLGLMKAGSTVLYNGDKIKPGDAETGVQLCPFSVKELAPKIKGDLVQNTIALAAVVQIVNDFAAGYRQAAGILRGQSGVGYGRRCCGRAFLLRLSHESFLRRAALDGAPRAPVGHHGAPGGRRDRCHP
jgi:2-oxoglutarate ferredoxin oxidoreductase subunit alpha